MSGRGREPGQGLAGAHSRDAGFPQFVAHAPSTETDEDVLRLGLTVKQEVVVISPAIREGCVRDGLGGPGRGMEGGRAHRCERDACKDHGDLCEEGW